MKPIFYWSEQEKAPFHSEENIEILKYTLNHREGEVAYVVIQAVFARAFFPFRWVEIFYEEEKNCSSSSGDFEDEPAQSICVFKGRLTNLPECIGEGVVRLVFSAVPANITEQLNLLEDTFKTQPYWDPLFFDEREGVAPRDLLEGQMALFYFNRVDHCLSLSNLFEGQKKDVVHKEILQDSFSLKITEIPLAYIEVCLQAQWVQKAQGSFNLFPFIARRFPRGILNTFTPGSFKKAWPETGKILGRSGYTVLSTQLKEFTPPSTGVLNIYPTLSQPFHVQQQQDGEEFKVKRLRRHWYKGHLEIGWTYQQKRQEKVVFCVSHCHQLKEQAPLKHKKLMLNLQEITKDDPSQITRSSFFETDRGRRAVQYGIQVAKAHLASKARCLVANFKVPLSAGLMWCPDTSLTVVHDFIPTGQSTGKILEITIHHSHEGAFCQVKVGFSLGKKEQKKESAGIDEHRPAHASYVEYDYLEEKDLDESDNQIIHIKAEGPVEGVVCPAQQTVSDFIKDVCIENHADQQALFLYANQYPIYNNVSDELTYHPTEIHIDLQDLRTKESLKRKYSLDTAIQFHPPQHVIID